MGAKIQLVAVGAAVVAIEVASGDTRVIVVIATAGALEVGIVAFLVARPTVVAAVFDGAGTCCGPEAQREEKVPRLEKVLDHHEDTQSNRRASGDRVSNISDERGVDGHGPSRA